MPASPQPTFAEIADALLVWLRHEAELNEIAEPFIAGLPECADHTRAAWATMQRRLVLFAEGQRLLAAMAPLERPIRAMITNVSG
jgi:hypothetical protein